MAMMKALRTRRTAWVGAVVFVAALVAIVSIWFLYSGRERAVEATAPAPGGSGDGHAGHGQRREHDQPGHAAPGRDSRVPGYAPVSIEPAQAAAMNLATAVVEERNFVKTLRSVGVITLDETRTAHVHSKVRGWIDDIHVNFTGRQVRDGESLASIYSQDVYSAELEFVSILETATSSQDILLEAARRRLALWDVPASEVERLERTREPRRTFPLVAPRSGVVVAKQALDGMYVDPAIELYTISDLGRVWALVDVYETDVPYVHVGDEVRLTVQGQPTPLDARVAFLPPTLDEATRTRKVRLELENPNQQLLPGAFASAEMSIQLGTGLAIPESAVIRTGTRSVVFVAHLDNAVHLEPREVTLGPLVGDSYRIEHGLATGERVATGAQFLLDSESRLRATSEPGAAHGH